MLNQCWFRDELRQLGHNVVTAGWYSGGFDITFKWGCSVNSLISLLPLDFKPDRIIYWDDSALQSVINIDELNVPSIFMSVDIHHHFAWHKHFANYFSLNLVAQKDYLSPLIESGLDPERVSWFPLWANANVIPAANKDIQVSFRGNMDESLHPGRKTFFDLLSTQVLGDFGVGPYPDVYARSKIVVNEAVRGDLNFRVFEGMISGALVITPRIGNGLQDLFEDGVNIVFYNEGDVSDCSEKIKYYLENEEERKKIAAAGRKLVMERHSLSARVSLLDSHLKAIESVNVVIPSLSRLNLLSERAKMLWVYLRKYHTYDVADKLELLLEDFTDIIQQIDFNDNSLSDYELSIFTLDTLAFDILGMRSYQRWLDSLLTYLPQFPIVAFIGIAENKNENDQESLEVIAKLKEARSTLINSFLM